MNQKVIAIILAVIMLMSILPLFFSSPSNTQNADDASVQSYAPGFDSIPGMHVNHAFNSIADGLAMTPRGITSAQYLDVLRINGTPLEAAAGDAIQRDAFYNSRVTKTYFAEYSNEASWFELDTISPEIIAFRYWLSPTPYNGYQLLVRDNTNYDICNVIGTPMIFGPQDKIESVIDVLSGNAGGSNEFDYLLSHVDDTGAEFQRVTSSTDNAADQYYIDIKMLDNGLYSRTVVYLNPADDTIGNLTQLQANSTERGLLYDTTTDGNITKVIVTSDLYTVITEPMK